eukprot:3248968-Prymnesium_polylepis.1
MRSQPVPAGPSRSQPVPAGPTAGPSRSQPVPAGPSRFQPVPQPVPAGPSRSLMSRLIASGCRFMVHSEGCAHQVEVRERAHLLGSSQAMGQ